MKNYLPKFEFLKYSFTTSIIGFVSGAVIFFNPILGAILFIIDLIVDAKIMETVDTREDLNDTKIELNKIKNEASQLLEDLKKTKREVTEVKEKTFDTFSKRGFMTIEERLKDIEKNIGIGSSLSFHDTILQRLEKIESKIADFERSMNRRY
ncbi:MAG: hypothetical protein WCT31_01670 [Candidatus Micrarchaeia archaeon]|jgi:septal ring factor EnvC (AmiA/AmiB activator)